MPMKMGDKDMKLPYDYPRKKWEVNCLSVTTYKEEMKRLFARWGGGETADYEKFIASIKGREVVLTIKYDGELNSLVFDEEHPFPAWFNKYPGGAGKMRTDIEPLSSEIIEIFKERGVKQIRLMGELYALSEDGEPLDFGSTLSIIVRPEGREKQIYFAVFDILELNGKPVTDDYWKKCLLLQDMFSKGKHIHPVFAKKGDSSVAEEMWKNKVLDEGYEGFVVHSDGTIKVKPIATYDLAVIGFVISPAKTYTDTGGKQIKTLVLAWMDEDGIYRYACNCGNGFDAEEQRKLATELNPTIVQRDVRIGGKYICHMVEPKLVVKIVCGEVLPSRDSEAWKWTGSRYELVGIKPSAALRFPRYVEGPDKFRRDKSATNWLDCRIHQIPDWGEPLAPPPVVVSEKAVDNPGTAKPEPKPEAIAAAVNTLEPVVSKFKPGQKVKLTITLGAGLEAGVEGTVKAVVPRPTRVTYKIEVSGKEIEVGEKIIEAVEVAPPVPPPEPEPVVEESKVVEKTRVVAVKTVVEEDAIYCIRPLF